MLLQGFLIEGRQQQQHLMLVGVQDGSFLIVDSSRTQDMFVDNIGTPTQEALSGVINNPKQDIFGLYLEIQLIMDIILHLLISEHLDA